MGLTIDRDDPAGRERRAMGGQNKTSEARIYQATDGTLVSENDPRAARLVYAVGSEVPAEKVEAYDAFMKDQADAKGDTNEAEERAKLRERVAPQGSGPATYTQPIGEKLATELADEAQDIANSDVDRRADAAEEADPDRVIARVRVGRTEEGELVAESDPRSTNLLYAEGDEIVDTAHRKAYRDLAAKADEADEDEAATTDTAPTGKKAPANKAADPGANKGAGQ